MIHVIHCVVNFWKLWAVGRFVVRMWFGVSVRFRYFFYYIVPLDHRNKYIHKKNKNIKRIKRINKIYKGLQREWSRSTLLFLPISCIQYAYLNKPQISSEDDVMLWANFDEDLQEMTKTPGTPENLWEVQVHLLREAPSETAQCIFYPPDRVVVGVSGESLSESCLAHEMAHRWVWLVNRDEHIRNPHGELWRSFERRLLDAVNQ